MLAKLFDHLTWADAQARNAIQQMPDAHADAARARTIYAHIAAAEHGWLARLEGRAAEHAVWPVMSIAAASALATETAARLRTLAASLDADELSREVTYRTSAGQEFTNTAADILAHVALHGSYHRGQLAMLVRQSGGQPVNTDYITFIRSVVAPPRV
jgi:uncharacterized damage-inducible protein DinB